MTATTVTVRYQLEDAAVGQLTDACDRLMEELVRRTEEPSPDVLDPMIVADAGLPGELADGDIEVSVTVVRATVPWAVEHAMDVLRAAAVLAEGDLGRSRLQDAAVVSVHAELVEAEVPAGA